MIRYVINIINNLLKSKYNELLEVIITISIFENWKDWRLTLKEEQYSL